MTAGAPWSVKGIDPKAREVAKHHARLSGMTLGAWLNRVILDDESGEAGAEAYAAPEPLRALARVSAEFAGNVELARVANAMDDLTGRLEAAETRTGLAISGVEHSVRQALARIDAVEREGHGAAARADGAIERLRRFETEAVGPRSTEALRAIEQSVSRMGGQFYEAEGRFTDSVAALEARLAKAEARLADPAAFVDGLGERLAGAEAYTSETIEALRRSLAALDGRLAAIEGGAGQGFEGLAETLARQVEAVRAEVSTRLASVDGGRVDRRFAELTQRVKVAEQRSHQAVQQMGRDVLAMAEAVNRRLESSEARAAEAVSQASAEMSRVAGALEARLGRAEQAQTQALERLSGELSRITDRLSERLLVSERRAAEAIDDVGEQVSRVTERMAQSQERTAQQLAERIRESEERTARLLEETRVRLEQRLGASPSGRQRHAETIAEDVREDEPRIFAPRAAAPEPARDADPKPEPVLAAPAAAAFGPELFSRAEDFEDGVDPFELTEMAPASLDAEAFEPLSEFAPIPEPDDDLLDLDSPEPPEDAARIPSLSTREVIEQARAAARAAGGGGGGGGEDSMERLRTSARASWRGTRSGRLGGLFSGWPKRPPQSTLQTAILVAGGAAFLSVGAAGVVLMQGPPAKPAADGASAPTARAAVALAPPALNGAAEEGPRPPAQLADALQTAFARAAMGIKAGEPGALAKVKALAEAGHPPAQFYLGKLYETGQNGVKQNWAEARRWTKRAAEGGDPGAMHNLALYDFHGDGGAQNLASAARWFRAAADLGVTDSQYNLGLLYQSGSGVERDIAQAYLWFSIAAARGDAQARVNAERLRPQLSAQQRTAADQAVGAFAARASRAAKSASEQAPAVSVVAVQRILGRLGYFKGESDGMLTSQFRTAVSAYQRDQRLPATGEIDQVTAQRLAAYTR